MSKKSIFDLDPEQLNQLLSIGKEPVEPAPQEPSSSADMDQAAPTASLNVFIEKPGDEIGRYKLLRVLGEGGMGIVYLAQQKHPIRRQVALKVIKPGMDSKRIIARFEAERQALALMDHPHIARVIDAGLTLGARPYFVMEHVKGIPITEHCDTCKLTVEERLGLFLHVCEAVQHAHQKGIIHRDLKPSNILVSIDGNKAVPKVIDFGVARAIGQQLTEKTLYTEQGQLIGTPEYMSPEQADMSNQDIDTRTDIYSLGVILYELLTGIPPFDPCMFQDAGIEHIRKVICEEEPKTPSTKLTTTPVEKLSESARRRGTNASALQRRLQGDLDWITLTAMEKDRTRRYASAGELAADIRRHLSQEPVLASPPSTIYRLNKFVRRHKGLVAGTLLALTVSLIGTVVSIIFAIGQVRARDEAQAVSDFLRKDVLWSLDLWRTGGREVTARSVLEEVSEKLEGKFEDKPLVEASIRRELGATYTFLGLYKAAEWQFKRTLDIHRAQLGVEHQDTLISMWDVGWVYCWQSRYHEAEPLLTKALQGMELLLDEDSEDRLYCMAFLAWLYAIQGRFNEADQLFEEGLSTLRRVLGEENVYSPTFMDGLAWAYSLQGRYKQAEQMYNRGLELSRRVRGEKDMQTLSLLSNLGDLYRSQGHYMEAEQLLDKALDGKCDILGKQHSETLETMAHLGWLYYARGLYEQAESQYIEALETSLRILGDAHFITAECLYGRGTLYLSQGRYDEAEALLERALEITNQIVGKENWATLRIMNKMATLYTGQGRYEEAEGLYLKTLEAQRHVLGQEHPHTLASMSGLAVLHIKQKQYENAERLFIQALELRRQKLGEDHPATLETKNDLAILYKEQARYHDAEKLLLEALEGRRLKLGDTHPHTLESWNNLIDLYQAWGKPEQANQWRAKLPATIDY